MTILYRDFAFPSNNEKFLELNCVIKELLEKKVNKRNCNSNVLKSKPFFDDFEWDKLIEFQMKPPFIPVTTDMCDHLKDSNLYELMVSEDNYVSSKKDKDDNHIPIGYDRNWAEEF